MPQEAGVHGDFSFRFLSYLTKISPKFASYVAFAPELTFPNLSDSITSVCYTDKQYMTQRRLRVLAVRSPANKDLPKGITANQPRRVLMPKRWTPAMQERITQLRDDPKVKFILFHVVCVGKDTTCADIDARKHSVVVVYNKARKDLEMWDDLYGQTQAHFSLYRLYRDFLHAYFIPVIAGGLGLKVLSGVIGMPAFSERWYMRIKRALETRNFENNAPPIYKAFLADYIERRVKNPKATLAKLTSEINIDNIPDAYDGLMRFTREWQISHRCEHPGKLMNIETGKCVSVNTEKAREILGIKKGDTCPYPELRNIATDRCKNIDIHEHYLDLNDDESSLSGNVRDSWQALMKYLTEKYPYMATSTGNKFMWTPSASDGSREWTLKKPADFNKLMKSGMTNPRIKYIVFYIKLTDIKFRWSHANTIIVDKRARTVERYEPNEPEEWDDFQNGQMLDDALKTAFDGFGLEYLPMKRTCPVGFQELEADEDSAGFKSNSGNCMIWALWYTDLRLANPDVPRDELVKTAWRVMADEGAFTRFITSYHHNLYKRVKAIK